MDPSQKTTRSGRSRVAFAIPAAVGGLSLVVVIGFVWLVGGSSIEDLLHRRRFDSTIWKAQDQSRDAEAWPVRLCMADDLLAGGRWKGLTRNQVIDLLGPPDSELPHFFSYYLGPERGFIRIDSETLVIDFDVPGKADRAWIHRD